ncbi:MAG: ligase-associated DNA damage response exonuclease, partial [Armatimonadetes bacterium]|nr:ligase-associated DNA damage response exonuclease [Armatimonadota bacterium]
MHSMAALTVNDQGLYCAAGDCYVDPWRAVETALITHAHGDHARPGSRRYYCAPDSLGLLRKRLGDEAPIEAVPYGESRTLGEARVSFHPAGHLLGAAQVRIETAAEVVVVSGDYKREHDPTCRPFEVVPCDTFVTEATFALPLYQWAPTAEVVQGILDWWERLAGAGRAGVLFCYALGKAQRLLAELGRLTDRPIYVHGAIEALNAVYRDEGVALPPTPSVVEAEPGQRFAGELVLAPPSAAGSTW